MNDWNSDTVYHEGIKEFISELNKNHMLSILSNTHYPETIHENGIRKPNKRYLNMH